MHPLSIFCLKKLLQVTYLADLFLDKNKDYVVAEHQALLTTSKCSFARALFPPQPDETSKSSKFSSIGSRFKVSFTSLLFIYFSFSNLKFMLCCGLGIVWQSTDAFTFLIMQLQLQSLMETLNSTEPHYIRCVKPNNVLKPAIFENSNVIQQLRCGVSMLCQIGFVVHLYYIWSYHLKKTSDGLS